MKLTFKKEQEDIWFTSPEAINIRINGYNVGKLVDCGGDSKNSSASK